MASLNPSILTCSSCGLFAPIGEFKPHHGVIDHDRLLGVKTYSVVYRCPICDSSQKVQHDKSAFEDIDSDPNR